MGNVGKMKTFKSLIESVLSEMSWDISELESYGSANMSTHEISRMKLKDSGDIYFVKFSDKDLYDNIRDSNIHPIIEYLTYKLYKAFDVKVPDVDLVVDNNRIGLASSSVKGSTLSHKDLLKTKNIKSIFAPSAFLANWDVLGTGETAGNILVNNGVATLIDPGGSLTFRARGGRKGDYFSNNVGEIRTLRDPEMSQAAEVFKNIDITKSIKDFLKVPWSKIEKILEKENKYIQEILKKLNNNIDKYWDKEYSIIKETLKNRYKYMKQLITKVL